MQLNTSIERATDLLDKSEQSDWRKIEELERSLQEQKLKADIAVMDKKKLQQQIEDLAKLYLLNILSNLAY
jgi:hypothetical protein